MDHESGSDAGREGKEGGECVECGCLPTSLVSISTLPGEVLSPSPSTFSTAE